MNGHRDELSILIVEDESTTRNGLKKHVHWLNLGIDRIRCAANGLEALSICREYHPDIVLSDVRMPGMDGVTLCRALRRQFPRCVFIFLSGYSDKEYLKAAIDLRAVSYIEKPTVISEVEEAIRKSVRLLMEERSASSSGAIPVKSCSLLQQNLVEGLINSMSRQNTTPEKLQKNLHALHLFEKNDLFFLVLIFRCESAIKNRKAILLEVDKLLQAQDVEHAEMVKDKKHIIAVLGSASRSSLEPHSKLFRGAEQTVRESVLGESSLFCAAGQLVQGIQNIPQSYQTAVVALQKLFFTGYGHLIFYHPEKDELLNFEEKEFFIEFSEALLCRNEKKTSDLLEKAYHSLIVQDTVLASKIKSLYFRLFYLVMHTSNSVFDEQDSWNQFMQTETLMQAHRLLCTAVQIKMKNSSEQQNLSPTIKTVINHIRTEYHQELLSVQQLADQVHLTPAYLSNLFKKETGITIGQYIVNVRMEHAKLLLQDGSCRLNEVAALVGYSDAGYFTKIFKKHMNMPPSQYKRQLSNFSE